MKKAIVIISIILSLPILIYIGLLGTNFILGKIINKLEDVSNSLEKVQHSIVHDLSSAIFMGATQDVKKLLENGADPNQKTKAGTYPIFEALNSPASSEIISILKKSGADLNIKNSAGSTPLILAINLKREQAALTLIELGADVNVTDDNVGNGPLGYSCTNSDLFGVTEALIKNKANLNSQMKYVKKTPLMLAAEFGNKEAVKLLLSHGANSALQDSYGKTAAFYARKNKHEEVAAILDKYR